MILDKDLTLLEQKGFLDGNTEKASLANKLEGKTKQYMKQLAVEWLSEKLWVEFKFAFSNNILEQAKKMEKQQIIDAFNNGMHFSEYYFDGEYNLTEAECYYNETYKIK